MRGGGGGGYNQRSSGPYGGRSWFIGHLEKSMKMSLNVF